MKKYIVYIEKAMQSTYFLRLIFELDNNEVRKVDEIIYPNCNKVKVLARKGEYYDSIYEQNIKILEEDEVAILKIPDLEELKEDNQYLAENENSSKFYVYLNKICLETVEDKLYEVLDLNNFIFDFFKFKHEKIGLFLDEPMTKKVFFEYRNNIYGPFKWKINGEKYILESLDQNDIVKKYNIDDLEEILYSIKAKNYSTKIIFMDDINLKLKKGLKEDKEDFIKSDLFIQQFINKIKSGLSKNEANLLKEKLKLPTIIFNDERKKIIEDKLIDNDFFIQIKENIIKDILEDENRLANICKKIATENFSEIKQNSEIEKILQKLKAEKAEKELELEALKQDIEIQTTELIKIKNNKEKELEIHNDQRLQNLKKELQDKQELLEKLNEDLNSSELSYKEKLEKLDLLDDLEKIKLENYYLERKQKESKKIIESLDKQIISLKEEAEKYDEKKSKGYSILLEEAIEKIKEEYKDNAFEFFTINKLQEIESEKNKEKLEEKLKKEILNRQEINNLNLSINEFIEKQMIFFNNNANREIEKNDLINIFLCISQGFLTILAGEPGTGKTSLCRILGKSLGLNTKENNRYLEVSVEKGWTSKRDFIGYYNPLNKQFDYANKRVFESLNKLNFESLEQINNYPFLFVLDEANLSPMEYYWADFMNICDMDDFSQREINIGDNYIYSVPQTLRFLATINYDHTTEVLSPRLLDRAWIILLENKEIDLNLLKNKIVLNSKEIVSYEIFKKFSDIEDEELSSTLANRLKEIITCLRNEGITISPRVQKMIKNYCIKGTKVFEKGKNDLISLDYAVSQKLLPLLEGYGDEYREFLKEFNENQLSGMEKCQKIVRNMILKGDKNMKHYYFFQN